MVAPHVRKLTRGAPCFTGLIGGYCSHWLRRLFRPHWAYFALLRSTIHNGRLAAPNGLQRSLVHWTSASPVSATGGGEAPSHRARASCAPRHYHIHNSQWSSCIFAPCRLRRPQRLPCARGAVGASRLRGCPCGLRFAPYARHFSPLGLRRSQARLRHSLLHWAYFALFRPQGARFVRPRRTRRRGRFYCERAPALARSPGFLDSLISSVGQAQAM